jgi:2-oxoglutarate dehydrogenase E2 component (dihydrolipoamide succinyltransferase)
LKADVLRFLEQKTDDADRPDAESESAPEHAPPEQPSPQPVELPDRRQTRAPMSRLRIRLAERLVQVQRTAAMLTTFNEADLSRVIELRKIYKESFKERHDVGLGFMSFFVKAVVEALKTVPEVNAFIEGEEIITNHYYDIGVAVSTEKGLVVPVVRDADRLSMAAIETSIADLAERAHQRRLELSDLTGAVFTVSNGGIFGSLLSTPILNPPGSAILGMHAIQKRPVVVDDEIVIRPMMYLALSYDHRIIDGREAVTFLKRIVECIEDPERLLLEV